MLALVNLAIQEGKEVVSETAFRRERRRGSERQYSYVGCSTEGEDFLN